MAQEQPPSTWSLAALAAGITIVGKVFNLFPEDPIHLMIIGFTTSVLFLVAQVLYSGWTGQTKELQEREEKYAKEVEKGHAFAVAILLLIKDQSSVWMEAEVFEKIFDVLSTECSSIIDSTSGGRTIKSLLAMKYCNDERANVKQIQIPATDAIETGLRTRLSHTFDLVQNGPKNDIDQKLVEEIPGIGVQAKAVVDHLTQSICLVFLGNGSTPEYITTAAGEMVQSQYGDDLRTYKCVEDAVRYALESEQIGEILEQFTKYKISIAGYGMGASIGTLLSYALLTEDKPEAFKRPAFETFAFAPLPCISSANCPKEINERVVTLLSRTDIVPRLTPQKIEASKRFFSAIGAQVEAARLVEECISPNALHAETYAAVDKILKDCPGVVHALEEEGVEKNAPQHVGQVFLLQDSSCTAVPASLVARLSVYEEFAFVLGHELNGYASCLKSLK